MPKQTQDFVVKMVDEVAVVRFINKSLIVPHEVERITAELNDLILQGTHRIVLDFKHVEYVSSSALSMLIALNHRLTDLKGGLVLSHPQRILELLDISKTRRLFKIADDPNAAIELLKAK